MPERLRVGVIGCGLIAQVMHLHYLRELADRFEIAALCDVSEELTRACARDYGQPRGFARWQDLLAAPVDAVLILTSGSHAPIAIAAAEAGKHMLIEKPMCFSVAEGWAMIEAARRARVTFMVGYNKRYDPAYRRLGQEIRSLSDLRLLRVTTLESPLQPYVSHYRLHRPQSLAPELAEAFRADNEARITAAIGKADALARRAYHLVLLDSMVHEFNAVRGLLGEPDSLDFVDIRENGLTVVLRFGEAQCIIAWVDLPGIARYEMELAFYAPDRRLTLSFPSPFLRSMPTLLRVEGGEALSPEAWCSEQVVAYAESFKEELIHFHDCVTGGRPPLTSGEDALGDIALCEAVIDAHLARRPRQKPTDASAARSMLQSAGETR
jgi:predicted dehydrogenase